MSESEPILFDEEALVAARNRRVKVLAGVGALAAMGLVAASAFVLTGDDGPAGGEPVDRALGTPVAATSEDGEADDAGADAEEAPARTNEVFSSRNPFTPLVDPAPEAPVADTGEAVPAAPAPAAPTTPPAVMTPTEPVTVAPTAGGTAPAWTGMTLVDIQPGTDGRPVATARVGEEMHLAAAGETFAQFYKVVSLDQELRCGQFLYGDVPFRLCVGEQIVK